MSDTPDAVEQELFWSELMDQLAARSVIPIIGQDLLEVEEGGVRTRLTTVIARRTLDRLRLLSPCGDAPTLNDVVVCYLKERGSARLHTLYTAVHNVVTDPALPIPDVLRTLAGIDAFKLYVTTAPDPLLQRAVDDARGAGSTLARSYSLEKPDDLPAPLDEIREPVVYHLLGRTAANDSYALTEEDTLEFLHSLHTMPNRPERLIRELKTRSLLVIGSGYPDWLTRFFLRVIRAERLRLSGPSGFLAEVSAGRDDAFVQFLRHFSGHTQVFPGDPRAFVSELAARWEEHAAVERARQAGQEPEPDLPPPQSVFLSYARQDQATVERLAEELRALGVPVWLDKRELQAGDPFEREIHSAIARCSLFVPAVSRQVLTYENRFFILEWRAAVRVARGFGDARRFILPCRIDDVPPDAENIPAEIRDLHMDDVVDDASRKRFAERVRDLYRQYQLERRPR